MKSLWFAVLVTLMSAGILHAAQEDEEECKRALEAFRTEYKGATEAGRVAAVQGLQRHMCEKSVGILGPMLTGEAAAVRVAAAKVLGTFDHPKAVEALTLAVKPNAERRDELVAIANALETLGWEAGALALNSLLSDHHDKDVIGGIDELVKVLGKMASPTSVEPLIKLLQHAENESKGVRRGKGKIGGNKQMEALIAPVRKALQEITGGTATSPEGWEDSWKANRERLLAESTLVYWCKGTGKRWAQKAGEAQECPHHDKKMKDGQLIAVRLGSKAKP